MIVDGETLSFLTDILGSGFGVHILMSWTFGDLKYYIPLGTMPLTLTSGLEVSFIVPCDLSDSNKC